MKHKQIKPMSRFISDLETQIIITDEIDTVLMNKIWLPTIYPMDSIKSNLFRYTENET